MSPRRGIPVMVLRGGTSKGAYFLADDLPADPGERDALLLSVMGSPDPRQIDGIGGGHPLTSKVAVIRRSGEASSDVDYLFLQVQVDAAVVSAEQPCGNILAGVGPFAIERGLVAAQDPVTPVRIRMVNTGALAIAHVPTPQGRVNYAGRTALAGVPGTAARQVIDFQETAGSVAAALLPTGNATDEVCGLPVTLIDNGMPVAIVEAARLDVSGHESPAELESQTVLRQRVEALRLEAGRRMGLGDVAATTVPKVCLVATPAAGGSLATRMFIPHRVHTAIGVLAAVTVATAAALPGSVAARICQPVTAAAVPPDVIRLEHPTGWFDTVVSPGGAAVVSTARLLLDGVVFAREEAQ
ncbi:FldA protein [Rhizocola hellebori]|uniref:FldA protein n=1 Tax=Rhizocola hellebori TaxID=1392758 RepID=A0A8J3VEZ1_9ACTN|nr:4-oxalomesaconate tautomerase [Rhizocola hellebori]GIH04914.1 FldA protein [Rhizocola hellebori]